MYGLGRSPNNSLMVVCGGEVVVATMHNAAAMDDVAVVVDVAAVEGVAVVVAIVVWVQQCWMRACTSL